MIKERKGWYYHLATCQTVIAGFPPFDSNIAYLNVHGPEKYRSPEELIRYKKVVLKSYEVMDRLLNEGGIITSAGHIPAIGIHSAGLPEKLLEDIQKKGLTKRKFSRGHLPFTFELPSEHPDITTALFLDAGVIADMFFPVISPQAREHAATIILYKKNPQDVRFVSDLERYFSFFVAGLQDAHRVSAFFTPDSLAHEALLEAVDKYRSSTSKTA